MAKSASSVLHYLGRFTTSVHVITKWVQENHEAAGHKKCRVRLRRCLWKAGPASRQNLSPASLCQAEYGYRLKKKIQIQGTPPNLHRNLWGLVIVTCRQSREPLHKSYVSPSDLLKDHILSGQVWKPTGLIGTRLRCYLCFSRLVGAVYSCQ